MTVIFRDIPPDDMILAVRAAKWLIERPPQRDAILAYGGGPEFYVKRNKASITVRPCA